MSLLILFTEPRRYTLACDSGSYSMTGNTVMLSHGWALVAETGSYSMIGNAVNLIYTVIGWALIGIKNRGIIRSRWGIRIGDRR